MSTPEERRSLFRVVSGQPSDDEIAALTVVLAAVRAAGAPAHDAPPPLRRWNDRAAAVRRSVEIGPGAWRASARPR